jgi:hypothetical protein
MTMLSTAEIDRSGFDGEVGWAIDKAMHFPGTESKEAHCRGPNHRQVFENPTERYEWVLEGRSNS